jgi:predicted AlkP superfamily phosphohydrolase/phosphomutase
MATPDLPLLAPDIVAYIGPGAGFTFVGSVLVLLSALVLVFVSIATWPFRLVLGVIFRRKHKRRKTGVRRVIILGLDGMDPRRVERLMREGRLPHMAQLAESGCYSRIESSCPPISPAAWSSFMTGTNPGKHNIFDFLNRNLQSYLPELSSSVIRTDSKGRAVMKLLRKSVPFWNILGEHGVFSTVLRVPITFPPEKFNGVLLSGMCVPDLRGSQGTFTCFAETPRAEEIFEGGEVVPVKFEGDIAHAVLTGPPAAKAGAPALTVPLLVRRNVKGGGVEVRLGKQRVSLKKGKYSEWLRVSFRAGMFRTIHGICRLLLVSESPFRLYVTPLNIDPEKPALPVSYPDYYSIYLAKLHGPYATLGLAEDTWAHTEGIIDDQGFLDQAYDIHEERERMFLGALRTTRTGLCACVFDTPDRMQHMFMRSRDAAPGTPTDPTAPNAILDDMYERMDALVGRTVKQTGKRDVLLVLSDHGFSSFDRGVNLNTWFAQQGFLKTVEGGSAGRYLQGIDWSATSAYSFGLAGIYLNLKGRESKGSVEPREEARIKAEITQRLMSLVDPVTGRRPVHAVHDASVVYKGPYARSGPDLVVGFAEGYRFSWKAAIGELEKEVFSDNTRSWGGDHCVDRSLVPGIFLCNRRLDLSAGVGLVDMAPTVLDLFGVPVPAHMDGKVCRTANQPVVS